MYYPQAFSPVRIIQPMNGPVLIPYNNSAFIRQEETKVDRSFIQASQPFIQSGYSYAGPAIIPSNRKQHKSGHKKTVSSFTGKSVVSNSESVLDDSIKGSLTPLKNQEIKQDSNTKSKTEAKMQEIMNANHAKEIELYQHELQELRKLLPQVEKLIKENGSLRVEAQKADDFGLMIDRVDLFLKEANKILEIPPHFVNSKETLLEKAARVMNANNTASLSTLKTASRRLNDIQQVCKRIQELRQRKAMLEIETSKGVSIQDSASSAANSKLSLINKEVEALKLLGEKIGELTDATAQERELRTQLIEKADELYNRNVQLEKMIQDQQHDLRELKEQRDRGLNALNRIEDYKALNISYIEERAELLKSNEELTALAQELNEKLEYILDENNLLREHLEKRELEIKEVKRVANIHFREENEKELQALKEQQKEQKNLIESLSLENVSLKNENDQKEARIRMWEEHNELLTREMDDIRNAFNEYKQSRASEDFSAEPQGLEDLGLEQNVSKNGLLDHMAKMAETNTKLSQEVSELRERELECLERIGTLERLLTYGKKTSD